eukprot:XP_001690471.1 predicted protein [Chlamydomonas reinhardtii]
MAQARQPLALSLAGFQFSYRSSYFDWRLLHGIDVDTVIRLTDVKAVEDCLDTLQHGSFGVERDRLSPANCVQLFRMLQLSIEYCAHLRAAHALLLDCYNSATQAAEGWKAAARAYLDAGSVLVQDSVAMALEGADREYNAALDALEAEDSRARHFRFRKQRTEMSWVTLHAADADRLVAALDVAALEALLPNLTYGCITNEDDEQLTPHHFAQIIPLAQAGLDYTLWQANATGALLEQAMAVLQASCGDIPLLTSATQGLGASVTSAQQPWTSTSVELGQSVQRVLSSFLVTLPAPATQYAGSGRLGTPQPLRTSTPTFMAGRAGSGSTAQLHRSTAELSFKVEAIEHDLRMERSKTEEMRRILADIRERLNQQHSQPGGAVAAAGGGLGLTSSQSLQSRHHRQPSGGVASLAGGLGHGLGGGGVTGVTDSVTFPAGGGGGSGSPFLNPPAASAALHPDHSYHSPAKVRVFVDEDAIREHEQQRAVDLLAKQAERLKQQEGAQRRSRGVSRDNSRRSVRHSSPSGRAANHGSRHGGASGMSGDYSSDPDRPPKPGLSRLSGPTAIHGSLAGPSARPGHLRNGPALVLDGDDPLALPPPALFSAESPTAAPTVLTSLASLMLPPYIQFKPRNDS